MVDWLVIWGAAQAAGFVFKPILEDLAKESAKDYTKDFFKNCLKKVIRLPEKDAQKEAYGKALKEFLHFVQQELEDADYQDIQIKQYIQPLRKFVEQGDVAAALGQAFEPDCSGSNVQILASTWRNLDSPLLPEEFSWEQVCKRYLKKVKAIIRESEKLRPIFEAQAQDTMAEGVQEIVGIPPEFDLGRYAEGLREQYGNLKLESLDTTGVYYDLKLWKLFIPQSVRECQEFFPQAYEIPKDHSRRLREQGQLDGAELGETELEQYRKVYVEQLLSSVLEVVGDPTAEAFRVGPAFPEEITPSPYVVILGDPGSGKSTLLQYLALVWAERPLSELPLYPIPLLIELRTYARDKKAGKCKDILSFIHSGSIICRLNQQQLHDKLKAGQTIALLDGIDEIFDPVLREQVVTDIHRFTNEYSTVRVIVTSRWLGYKAQRLRDAGFRHFMLQDLEADQIELFIQRWHDLTFVAGADKVRKQERLQKAIQDSKAIRELAGNPLLLTMMAILNRNQELPRDRPELYNQASRVLLHQWDVESKLLEDPKLKEVTIDYKDKQAMLRKVAYHMQSSEKGLAGNLISADDLENILTDYLRAIVEKGEPRMIARVMIEQLRTRNFILCFLGADSYAFVHRTFLEYFCAWEFVDQFEKQRTLDEDQLKQKTFGEHWQDESWHEVLRLIAGMIDAKFVANMIDFLLGQKVDRYVFLDGDNWQKKEGLSNLLLAANCFSEVRNKIAIEATSTQLLKLLQHEIEQQYPYPLDPETVSTLINLIATIGQEDSATLHWLKKTCLRVGLSPVLELVADLLVLSITRGWKDDPETLPWLKTCAQTDKNNAVRRAAVQELAQGWKDDPETLPILKTCAQTDKNNAVRYAAVQELARGWKDDPETLPWLKTCAQTDKNNAVRRAAVQELAQGWKDDPETLPILKTCAQTDESSDVRQAAVQELAQGWKDDPETLPLLKSLTHPGNTGSVRGFAADAIAKYYPNDSDSLSLLKSCVQSDEDWSKRRGRIHRIACQWKEDPETLCWLVSCFDSNDDGFVRGSAVEMIAKNWKDHPNTLKLLTTSLYLDRDWQVRWASVEALARDWHHLPDFLDLLFRCAVSDPFERQEDLQEIPRQAAIKQIVFHYPTSSATKELLIDRVSNDPDEEIREFAKQKLAQWER